MSGAGQPTDKPSQSPTVDAEPQKRKRGRPKKGEERVQPNHPVIKKKRGRPRKTTREENKEDSPVKRKRGRPKATHHEGVTASAPPAVSEGDSPVKKKRGRPKATHQEGVTAPAPPAVSEEDPPVKKKRGRPKAMHPAGASAPVPPPAVSKEDPPAKKKRGQPKSASSVTLENGQGHPTKRKPGRPRKIPVPSVGEKVEEVIPLSLPAAENPTSISPQLESPILMSPGMGQEDSEQDVMGKLQVSFSESESEGSDPMNVPRSAIDALTHRVAPLPQLAPQQSNSLFLDNQFEESFDEDSDN